MVRLIMEHNKVDAFVGKKLPSSAPLKENCRMRSAGTGRSHVGTCYSVCQGCLAFLSSSIASRSKQIHVEYRILIMCPLNIEVPSTGNRKHLGLNV